MKEIKAIVIGKVIEKIEAQIKNTECGQSFSIKESKEHKGAMESRYDTFKEEAQYLAGGFNVQLLEQSKVLKVLKSIVNFPPTITRGSSYAIVEVENLDDESRIKYFLLPAGGGDTYEVDGEKITILGIGAPMARVFIGAVAGDEVEVKIQGTTKRFSVVSVT
jgi:transcription elongation GreA/GreB family factor